MNIDDINVVKKFWPWTFFFLFYTSWHDMFIIFGDSNISLLFILGDYYSTPPEPGWTNKPPESPSNYVEPLIFCQTL